MSFDEEEKEIDRDYDEAWKRREMHKTTLEKMAEEFANEKAGCSEGWEEQRAMYRECYTQGGQDIIDKIMRQITGAYKIHDDDIDYVEDAPISLIYFVEDLSRLKKDKND